MKTTNVVLVKAKGFIMSYTERMRAVVERTNARGNVDTVGINDIASIIWDMEQRIIFLENQLDEAIKAKAPKATKAKPVKTKSGVGTTDVAVD